MDGASVSQFEQHIRAIAGWPLAVPVRLGRIEMTNLIGEEVPADSALAADPGRLGAPLWQGEQRPGRKMGHVTRVLAADDEVDPVP